MISKKKKKKGLRQNPESFFGRNPKFKGFFRPKLGDLKKKKKKKKVFAKIQSHFSSNFANSDVWGGALSVWGGYFPFFTENQPQKHKKHAILHTSQAIGGGSSPPRPPLATLLIHRVVSYKCSSFWQHAEHVIPYISLIELLVQDWYSSCMKLLGRLELGRLFLIAKTWYRKTDSKHTQGKLNLKAYNWNDWSHIVVF